MIKITFVCHGNICRSPMAEYIFKDLVEKQNISDKFEISSFATSNEALGEEIYPPAKRQLEKHGIKYDRHISRRIDMPTYKSSDYVICMEEYNVINLKRFLFIRKSDKISLLLDHTKNPRDLVDPWYSHDFETAYREIEEGCKTLLEYLTNKHDI